MTTFRARISRRNMMIAAAALTLASVTGRAEAQAAPEPVTLRVMDRDTGQELRIWRHNGRLFVEGQPDVRYGLRVTNNTNGRVLVVMSVDGVNILTGETASYGQRGYVFTPFESYDVNGWRKSDTEVAAFSFAPIPQSYAARTGRPLDVGVIGIAVFTEKPEITSPAPSTSANHRPRRPRAPSQTPPPPLNIPIPPLPLPPIQAPPRASASGPASPPVRPPPPAPAPLAAGAQDAASHRQLAPQGEKLGTAHGASEWSVATTVDFERATSYPQFVRQIEYDSHANLVASGVIPRFATTDSHPHAFPSASGDMGYVPDPPQEP